MVGKFVEFFGAGRARAARGRPRHHRQHGARVRRDHGLLPGRRANRRLLRGTGRSEAEIDAFETYFQAQELFGIPKPGEIDYSQVVELDLGTVEPALAGPKRPQDRIALSDVAAKFAQLFSAPVAENGFDQPAEKLTSRHEVPNAGSAAGASPAVKPGAPRDVVEMADNRSTMAAAHTRAEPRSSRCPSATATC